MAIKKDFASLAANFMSVKELVVTLSKLEDVSKQNVITWLLNVHEETPLPKTYSFNKKTKRIYKDGNAFECLSDNYYALEDSKDLDDDYGWLRDEITPYIKKDHIKLPAQGNANNEAEQQPVQPDEPKLILTAQPENAAQPILDKPITTRERNSLLIIIAALAKEAKIDLSKPSKAGVIIEDMTARLGSRVDHETISQKIKMIADALESRAK